MRQQNRLGRDERGTYVRVTDESRAAVLRAYPGGQLLRRTPKQKSRSRKLFLF